MELPIVKRSTLEKKVRELTANQHIALHDMSTKYKQEEQYLKKDLK